MSSIPLSESLLPVRRPLQRTPTSASVSSHDDRPLDASRDARRIVRLAQCSQCSLLLDEPVTLPCGNSLCKKCIPKLHLRPHITYPRTPERLHGFTCPFKSCGEDHAIEDCAVNVVLNKVMETVKKEMTSFRSTAKSAKVLHQVEERDKITQAGLHNLKDRKVRTRKLQGGRLVSTYSMAEMGELAYDSEVTYTPINADEEGVRTLDEEVLGRLQDITRSELDCEVCYQIFMDPFTTSCGHTFCRTCLHRVLDHSNMCPLCRREQAIPPGLNVKKENVLPVLPSNRLIGTLLTAFCSEALASRMEMAEQDEMSGDGDMNVPLFLCILAFPTVPTFLHVFEPRYRLMIRRVMESGERTFGMVMHNSKGTPQGELGVTKFNRYGTLLYIVNITTTQDGRFLIETRGVSRFKVVKHGVKDNYIIGKVERIDDITVGAEEAQEASELSAASLNNRTVSAEDHLVVSPSSPSSQTPRDYNTMSTQALYEYGRNFYRRMRAKSAPWLHYRVLQVYGECPEDPAQFAWWFVSIIPIDELEKYALLQTTSVRERLKACAVWIESIEERQAYAIHPTYFEDRIDEFLLI